MLYDKNYDAVLLGKSYLSYLFSLYLIKSGKRVLLIDDPRVSYGENWPLQIGLFEKYFLQNWGHELDISFFKNLQNYLKPAKIYLNINGKRVKIGDKPHRNLSELYRKFPNIFKEIMRFYGSTGKEQFDQLIHDYTKKIVAQCLKGPDSFNKKLFEDISPKKFNKLFQNFHNEYFHHLENDILSEKHFTIRNFIYLCQSFFQFKVSDTITLFELYHLLLTILSPQYQIDQDKLTQDLHIKFMQDGGKYKKTPIECWMIYKGLPYGIQLSSYEGHITPGEIYYMGHHHLDFPFLFEEKRKSYGSFIIEINYPQNIFTPFLNERILCSHHDYIGTDLPLWEIFFTSPNCSKIKVLFSKEIKGLEKSFFNKAKSLVFQDMQKTISNFDSSIADECSKLINSCDEWIDTKNPSPILKNKNINIFKEYRIISLYDSSFKNKIDKIYYWGPLRSYSLGLFSFLFDLRAHHLTV